MQNVKYERTSPVEMYPKNLYMCLSFGCDMVESTEDRAIFAQVSLPKSQLEKLKRRSGMITTEEALQTAVSHYLGCPEISINSISGSARGEEEVRGREREEEKERARAEGVVLLAGKVKTPNHGYVHGHEHEHETNRKLLEIEMEIMSQGKRV